MERKYALIVGNDRFEDPHLACLVSPASDVRALADLLKDPEIGGFDEVTALVNEPEAQVRRSIASLFARKKSDDLLLLYFSTHGLLDENGLLFLASRDTQRDLLNATSVEAAFVTQVMNNSLSRRQVLILDCCHSGAFARGTKGAPGASVGTASAFEGNGFGRVVLTATDSTQYAWDGDKVTSGSSFPTSVFTRHLIEGLRTGAADEDDDGRISLDELYEYVYRQVLSETRRQTPGKWSYRQQGDLIIARNPFPDRRAASLPDHLRKALESDFPPTREGAIRELERYLRGTQAGLARTAEQELEKVAAEDDSRKIRQLAAGILASFRKESQKNLPVQPTAQITRTEPSRSNEIDIAQPAEDHNESAQTIGRDLSQKRGRYILVLSMGLLLMFLVVFQSAIKEDEQSPPVSKTNDALSPAQTEAPATQTELEPSQAETQPLPGSKTAIPPPPEIVATASQTKIEPSRPEEQPTSVPEVSYTQSPAEYFRPCLEGTRNVIVASGYTDLNTALGRVQSLRSVFPGYKFKLISTVAKDGSSNFQYTVLIGHGLSLAEARDLVNLARRAGIAKDAYDTSQDWNAECKDISVNEN